MDGIECVSSQVCALNVWSPAGSKILRCHGNFGMCSTFEKSMSTESMSLKAILGFQITSAY